jgi:hypothetical protein
MHSLNHEILLFYIEIFISNLLVCHVTVLLINRVRFCHGNLTRTPRVAGYGLKFLNMVGFLQRQMTRKPYTPYQEIILPL